MLDIFKDEPKNEAEIIAKISDELQRRKDERRPLEAQWRLNANFLMGNQWCAIDEHSFEIKEDDAEADFLYRDVYNRIAPLYNTRLAHLNKIKFYMSVQPRTNELEDIRKADVSTIVLRQFQSSSGFEVKKSNLIAWAEIAGTSFFLSWWDRFGGEKIAEITETVTDAEGNLIQEKKPYYEGNIDYGMLSPYEVYPESIYKQHVADQRSFIIEQVFTVDDILDRYGVLVEGKDIDSVSITPVNQINALNGQRYSIASGISYKKQHNSERVITYLERPGKKHPKGLLAIIIGDRLQSYGDLPYDDIPLQKYTSYEVAGQFFGKSFIEDEIPLQRAYNRAMNQIHFQIKKSTVGTLVAEAGSIENIEDYEDKGGVDAGDVVIVREGAQYPRFLENTSAVPAYLTNERTSLENQMMYVACLSTLQVEGNTPNGVTSGTAINTLKDSDNTRISLQGSYLRDCIKNLAKCWLGIFKQYATTYRALKYAGLNNFGIVEEWSKDDITDYDISYDTQNELEVSEEEQRERFLQAYNSGAYTDSDGRIPQRVKNKMASLTQGDYYKDLMSMNERHQQRAERENVMFSIDKVLPTISEFDDDDIHIESHTSLILETKYEIMKEKYPELCRMFENHIREHQTRINEKAVGGMVPVS